MMFAATTFGDGKKVATDDEQQHKFGHTLHLPKTNMTLENPHFQ